MVEQLLSLPADALLVLRLRKLEGFSFLTIAEMLDIPVDEVEGHLRAALHQLLSLAPRAVASDGA